MKDFVDSEISFYPDKITYVGNRYAGIRGLESEPKEELVIMHDWETEMLVLRLIL